MPVVIYDHFNLLKFKIVFKEMTEEILLGLEKQTGCLKLVLSVD